jgi:5-methylthioadenosine/S-adenosylhomocysteine deaminase
MLIKGGIVVLPDGSWTRPDIRIEGAFIGEVGELEVRADEISIDASRRLVIPGLVDAHAHSNEGLMRGGWDALPLELWLSEAYPVSGGTSQSARSIYLRTLVAGLERLLLGTTCVVDFLYELPYPTEETVNAVARAYSDVGIRAVILVAVWDSTLNVIKSEVRRSPGKKTSSSPDRRYWVPLIEELRQAVVGHDRVSISAAISQPQHCSDGLMEDIGDLSQREGCPIHTHALESKASITSGRERFGTTPIKHLARLELMSERLSLAHCVWADRQDLELIAASGANVVHNPVSNLKLGSGIAPWAQFCELSIPVAIGTDGESTNDSRDMFEASKMAAIVHRVTSRDYRVWPTAWQVFAAATKGGARAAGLPDEVGSIEPGRRADIVMLDLDHLSLTPLVNPLNQLVFAGPGAAVSEVFVDGRLVVADGRSTLVDARSIVSEIGDQMPAERARRNAATAEALKLRSRIERILNEADTARTS